MAVVKTLRCPVFSWRAASYRAASRAELIQSSTGFRRQEDSFQVHSFYRNQDQLGLQDQFFRNRTSLFKDQISRGNASLQLTGVEVQDQGRYRCYTSTVRGEESSFINLKVDAPVSKVKILRVENRISCSSEGIYPEPDLTWSTRPPSNLTLQNQTSIQQTEQQL
ncbi:hemicentin-2-like isoform X1 [Lates japonicus]|uniref:Hemicentin-2-like isoform X1 n=1 Tax=Lates japonicus TaxID=270547 RepID=A0AAD3MJA9_LATJO|nr:hemicentin-2-like isoform X1 [Lates japonicus]